MNCTNPNNIIIRNREIALIHPKLTCIHRIKGTEKIAIETVIMKHSLECMKYVAAENIGTRKKIHKRLKLSEKHKNVWLR